MARQVICVARRGDHCPPHLRIAAIGGDGWWVGEAEAIATLRHDLNAYFLETPKGTEYLVVRRHEGRDYLTTETDGLLPADLLALPSCP